MKTDNPNYEQLHTTALKAPSSSGVYLWRSQDGTILYVGKAKNLKNRLSSYFSGQKDVKTRILVSRAFSIEYITTANEYEALILESTLIKQHTPRYNINLKDDKSYPVLRITNEEFPRIFKTRRIIQDGSHYFGPFPNVAALDTFVETVYRRYPLRHCRQMRKRTSPCMYYHIGRCAAPCCGKITQQSYMEYIDEIIHFLEGKPEETIKKLESEMKTAAKTLQFEKAARLRDGIEAVKMLQMVNTVSDFNPESRDYIGYYTDGPLVSFAVLKMRSGRLVGRDIYRTKTLNNDDEILSEFFMAYYSAPDIIPPRIFIPEGQELELVREWISRTFSISPEISTLDTAMEDYGRHEASMAMAHHNAKEDIARRMRERGDIPAMEELKKLLDLGHLPVRIEGFDIAHIHGKFPVASLVSFYNGNPDKKNYRYFRLKTTDGIIDDFASMREASARRYTRLKNEHEEMPDLIVIDGGIGQVNAVEGVLSSLSLDIPVIGLAKRDEEIFLPHTSKPICLPKRSDALRLLQRVRDETHRFATSRNQTLRSKENTVSAFTKLPGIGPKKAAALFTAYGSIEKLAEAAAQDIAKKASVSVEKAQDILVSAQKTAEKREKAGITAGSGMNGAGSAPQNNADGLGGGSAVRGPNARGQTAGKGSSAAAVLAALALEDADQAADQNRKTADQAAEADAPYSAD